MTRIALVGAHDWTGVAQARRAVTAVLPEAQLDLLPPGADPVTGVERVDGVWLLPPPPGTDPQVHDRTTARALDLGIPLVGPVASTDEGGATPFVGAVPGSRLAGLVGETPLELPQSESGGRAAREYVTAPGTVWFPEAHRGSEPAVVTAGGTPFVTLSDHALATDAGVHPLLLAFAAAVREHAAPPSMAPPRSSGGMAPLPDDEPRSYLHQMRMAGYRWWRPVLALALGVGVFIFIALALGVVWWILEPSAMDPSTPMEDIDLASPVTMLMNNLMLAGLIPAALVATRLGHWRPMGTLFSVAGRIRWRWLGRATLVTLLLWSPYIGLAFVVDDIDMGGAADHWGWLLAITLLTTPLQAAGEEVAMRGALMQGIGAWIRRPAIALTVTTVISAAVFALLHTSLDPWVLTDLAIMAAAMCYLTWRTGGLEAAIALHAVNNVLIISLLTVLGGLDDAYITETTTGTATASAISGIATLLMTAVLLWQARRAGIAPKGIGQPALG